MASRTFPQSSVADAPVESRVGQELKRHRERQGLSVRTMAARANCSASFVSQVENGLASPSLASLERLAAAVGVGLPDLFAPLAPRIGIVRAKDRPAIDSSWSKARLEFLSAQGTSAPDGVMVTLEPGGSSGSGPAAARADQLVVIFDGHLTLTLADSTAELHRGDAVVIRARTPYRWANLGVGPAQMLVLTTRAQ